MLPVQCKVVMTSGVGINGNWCPCTFWYFCKVQKGSTPTEEEKWRFHLLPWWPQWILFYFTVEGAEKPSVTIVYLTTLTASQIARALLSSLELGGIPAPRDGGDTPPFPPPLGWLLTSLVSRPKAGLMLALSLPLSCLFKELLASKTCAKDMNEIVQMLFQTRSWVGEIHSCTVEYYEKLS